jgi:hypothetical protein
LKAGAIRPVLKSLSWQEWKQRRKRKAFFSEEKKQKTFILSAGSLRRKPADRMKFFGSFVHKRTTSLSIL